MIYVFDRNKDRWRAQRFYRDEQGIRLYSPEKFDQSLSSGWTPYAPGGRVFEGAAKDVWIPYNFIERLVL